MKAKLTENDVVKGFELLGKDKTVEEVKALYEKYKAMTHAQEKFDGVNSAIKKRVGKMEEAFGKIGITFSEEKNFALAYFDGGIELCSCDEEWAEIYDVTIATLDKIFKTFTGENPTEESKALKEKWYDLFNRSGLTQVLDQSLQELKAQNAEVNELWKKSIEFYGDLTKAQTEFCSLTDSNIFEKYFAKRMENEENKNKKVKEALERHEAKIHEIIELFKKHGIVIDNSKDFEHFAYIISAEGPKFLCACDAEYEFIPTKALRTLEEVKKAIANGDPIAREHWKKHIEYFEKLNLDSLKSEFEKLNKEDEVLYKAYVDVETEKFHAEKE